MFFETASPSTMDTQPLISDPSWRAKVRSNIEKVINRRYILTTGLEIKSLIKYFDVPKGDDEFRLVYDGTNNLLNPCVWVPTFWLPTVDSLLRSLDNNSWMTYRDVADMFMNYQLDPAVVPLT